ncbi:hypothetical protein [Ostreiculturibacter nitratireducens]|uniref:hypothetical protein n=1 Tax=Ostreiculturibacter nitratireducens TaxID=3075226 RepID=UPI0031B59540
MHQKLFALSLGFAGLILAAHNAYGETTSRCSDHASVVGHLAGTYGETRRGIGLSADNTVVEVFASTETGTWTITFTTATGHTCLMASGEGFEPVAEEPPAIGDPA